MNDACDLERFRGAYNEHQAYLMGWICDCINKARLGIGDFVEIKDKEEQLMRNYCYKVSKNGWRSHDKIDTITGIHVYELNKTKHETELCEKV